MSEVWDEHWFGSTKTLDVHVAALRRKLATAAGAPAPQRAADRHPARPRVPAGGPRPDRRRRLAVRRRIISLTVLAALVATVLFALPLGIAVMKYYRRRRHSDLERAADAAALAVSHELSAGLAPEVPPPADEDEAETEVGVYSPEGRLLAGHGPAAGGPLERQAASATVDVVTGSEGDDLVLAVPVLSGSRVTGVVRAPRCRSPP